MSRSIFLNQKDDPFIVYVDDIFITHDDSIGIMTAGISPSII